MTEQEKEIWKRANPGTPLNPDPYDLENGEPEFD